jgi:hypothetical protein
LKGPVHAHDVVTPRPAVLYQYYTCKRKVFFKAFVHAAARRLYVPVQSVGSVVALEVSSSGLCFVLRDVLEKVACIGRGNIPVT